MTTLEMECFKDNSIPCFHGMNHPPSNIIYDIQYESLEATNVNCLPENSLEVILRSSYFQNVGQLPLPHNHEHEHTMYHNPYYDCLVKSSMQDYLSINEEDSYTPDITLSSFMKQ
jgi:hypothetical protein